VFPLRSSVAGVLAPLFTVPSTLSRDNLAIASIGRQASTNQPTSARPYYVCAALTADLLAPARGLLAISTWPMERRVIGSLSPRVDFLSAAIQVAEAIERLPAPVPAARRLLWRFAASIPGAAENAARMTPQQVTRAAEAELEVHEAADNETRRAAAVRARSQLDDAEQLFGTRLR
jgi:hypothetical protein